mgnify:FL=1
MKEALVVGAGATLGALTRWALTISLPLVLAVPFDGIHMVNALGCLAMGFLAPGKFWGTGFLGGFTTFSGVAIAAALSSPLGAIALLAVYFVVCVGAWLLGDALRTRTRGTA